MFHTINNSYWTSIAQSSKKTKTNKPHYIQAQIEQELFKYKGRVQYWHPSLRLAVSALSAHSKFSQESTTHLFFQTCPCKYSQVPAKLWWIKAQLLQHIWAGCEGSGLMCNCSEVKGQMRNDMGIKQGCIPEACKETGSLSKKSRTLLCGSPIELRETCFLFNMHLHFSKWKLREQINFIHIYKNFKFQSQ